MQYVKKLPLRRFVQRNSMGMEQLDLSQGGSRIRGFAGWIHFFELFFVSMI